MRAFIWFDNAPGPTFQLTSTDTPGSVSSSIVDGARSALLTVENYSVRLGLGGTTPTQGSTGLGHLLEEGDVLRLQSPSAIRYMQYISASLGQAGLLQVTVEY